MKKLFTYALLLMTCAVFAPTTAFAVYEEHDGKSFVKGKQCDATEDCGKKDYDKCGSYKCPIVSKLMKKAGFFLSNAKEIGLSDEQVAQIKAIKTDTKKAYIRTEAEMQVFEIDMNAKLSEPKVDVDGLNSMIDQAMAGWSTGAKKSIADYAKLKAVLNEEQMAKAKEIWSKDDKK